MQTRSVTHRLSFKPATLDALTIESKLPPADVIENIRAAGREWRASAVPEDLRKFSVSGLGVEISGYDFVMHWGGNLSPLFNPACYGAVGWAPGGSRIRIGFGRNPTSLKLVALYALMGSMSVLMGTSRTSRWLGVMMLVLVAVAILHNRNEEPMRSRLIDVVDRAAHEPVTPHEGYSISTNGP
jgi:hypothetical protein